VVGTCLASYEFLSSSSSITKKILLRYSSTFPLFWSIIFIQIVSSFIISPLTQDYTYFIHIYLKVDRRKELQRKIYLFCIFLFTYVVTFIGSFNFPHVFSVPFHFSLKYFYYFLYCRSSKNTFSQFCLSEMYYLLLHFWRRELFNIFAHFLLISQNT
jgi:hypothetical protein